MTFAALRQSDACLCLAQQASGSGFGFSLRSVKIQGGFIIRSGLWHRLTVKTQEDSNATILLYGCLDLYTGALRC